MQTEIFSDCFGNKITGRIIMKKIMLTALVISVMSLLYLNCSSAKTRQLNFVEACYNENSGRDGLPMSQIELLYEGIKKADDTTARQTLKENCPKAYKEYLR
jgi:hypothetical protein